MKNNFDFFDKDINPVSYTHLDVYKRQANDSLNRAQATKSTIQDLNQAFSDVNGWQTAYALEAHRQDPRAAVAANAPTRKAYVDSYAATKAKLDGVDLSHLTGDEKALVDVIKKKYAAFGELDAKVVAGFQAGTPQAVAAADTLVMEDEFVIYGELTEAAGKLTAALDRDVEQAQASADRTANTCLLYTSRCV